MANNDLIEYIAHQRKNGKSDDDIKNVLLRAGWPEQAIYDAMKPGAADNMDLNVPMPPASPYGTPAAPVYTHGINPNELISPSDLLQDSWNLFKLHFGKIFKIELLVIGASVLVGFIIIGLLVIVGFSAQHQTNILSTTNIAAALVFILIAWLFLCALVGFAVWARLAMIDIAAGNSSDWKMSLQRMKPKIIGLLATDFLSALIIVVGAVLVVIPGFIFQIWFSLATYAVAIEGVEGLKALKLSRAYVRKRFWRIFGRQLVLSIIASMGLIPAFIAFALHWRAVGMIYMGLFELIFVPFSIAYMFKLYSSAKETSGLSAPEPYKIKYPMAFVIILALAGLLAIFLMLASIGQNKYN